MAVLKNSDEQTTKLFQQLLNLLEEMHHQASEQDKEEDSLDETGLIQSLVEEAEERGLDEDSVERILKMASQLRKKSREE